MENIALLVLLSAAIVGVFGRPAEEDGGQCDVNGSSRIECGWLGIGGHTCLKRGCCWDSSDRNAKFCFVRKGQQLLEGQCPVAPSERKDCGYSGITREQCVNRTCCWDDSVYNAKWCFHKPGECDVSGSSRKECGWLGIDEQTCLKRGCCFDNSDPNAKYCFVQKRKYLLNGQCPVAPSERHECGYYGITREQCINRTCCWDDSVQKAKWCFQQPILPTAYCYIYHGISGICRYTCREGEYRGYGIFSCGGRICCCYTGYGK